MAAGDITFYDLYKQSIVDGAGSGLSSTPVDWDTDTIKVAVMTNAFVPDTDEVTTQLHWSNVSAQQVGTATGYTGPITLAGVTVSTTGGTVTVDFSDVTIPADAGGFTNGRWLVFYKDSGVAATSPLLAIGDLGADKGNTTGSLTFNWNATGLFTLA